MTDVHREADIAVVGGGLVGTALAYGLARRGAAVLWCDAGDDRLHASGGNFGLVWVQGKGRDCPEYARLTRRSADAWQHFADDLIDSAGMRADEARPADEADPAARLYRPSGGLKIALSDVELDRLRTDLARLHNDPDAVTNEATLIDRQRLLELEPAVGPAAIGAIHCAHDGHADPLATLATLYRALARHPGVERHAHRVLRIDADPARSGVRLETVGGHRRAARVVLAAGHGIVPLASPLGLDVPLRPRRGQILVTERAPPQLRHACHTLRQTSSGTILIGDSHEDVGFDLGTTRRAAEAMLARAITTFPALARLRIHRSWAALRVLTPDGLPIYHTSHRYPSVSVVTCHSGVTLAAAHADELAEAVLEDRLNERFAAFSLDRFHHRGVHDKR